MLNMFMRNKKFFFMKKRQSILSVIERRRKYFRHLQSLRQPVQFKNNYNSIIPLVIYQTWHSKDRIPNLMQKSINKLRMSNPRFNYQLFDDNDCREFIKNNFDEDVLNAFDTLIPGAYKADLWRYCILYKMGGIYLDIKYSCCNNFRLIHLTESEHFCADLGDNGIYNAILVALPGNEILYNAIRKIVENVNTRYYGNGCLDPTGPMLLAQFINVNNSIVDLKHLLLQNDFNQRAISFQGKTILKSYSGYIVESKFFAKVPHYARLWSERKIYK